MTAVALEQNWITPEEYLAGEPLSDIRHEYACGRVYAMAGSSDKHNYIAGNLLHPSITTSVEPRAPLLSMT